MLANQFQKTIKVEETSNIEDTKAVDLKQKQQKFVSWKLLQQEYVANQISTASENNVKGTNMPSLVIGICDEEDIKFGFGIEERTKRLLSKKGEESTNGDASSKSISPSVYSILINPSAKDSLSYTTQLRLTLGYGDSLRRMKPLADYVWFSEYPMTNLLTNMQNPIDFEGQKGEGQSSLFGVF